MRNGVTVTSYSAGSKVFHWLIAVIIITMLMGSFFLDDLSKQYQPIAFMIHKSLGITVLFLMIARIALISYKGKPPLPETVPHWERLLSKYVQYSLYFFAIAMPLSGWIKSIAANKTLSYFGLFNITWPSMKFNPALSSIMKQAHYTIAWILIGLVLLHVAGALKHHFIDKDGVLRRMLTL